MKIEGRPSPVHETMIRSVWQQLPGPWHLVGRTLRGTAYGKKTVRKYKCCRGKRGAAQGRDVHVC